MYICMCRIVIRYSNMCHACGNLWIVGWLNGRINLSQLVGELEGSLFLETISSVTIHTGVVLDWQLGLVGMCICIGLRIVYMWCVRWRCTLSVSYVTTGRNRRLKQKVSRRCLAHLSLPNHTPPSPGKTDCGLVCLLTPPQVWCSYICFLANDTYSYHCALLIYSSVVKSCWWVLLFTYVCHICCVVQILSG